MKIPILLLALAFSGSRLAAQHTQLPDRRALPQGASSEQVMPVIPAIFTPNGDGENDQFEIQHLDRFPNNKLTVYDRWGQVVYSAFPYQNDWDGTHSDTREPLPSGQYLYHFQTAEARPGEIKGPITIIR